MWARLQKRGLPPLLLRHGTQKRFSAARTCAGSHDGIEMKKHHLLALSALIFALLFAGCQSEPASRSIIMAAPPQNNLSDLEPEAAASEAEEAPPQDEPMALYTATTGLSGAYAGDENGCYSLAQRDDGSADILYFNYNDATMTMLDKPEEPTDVFGGHVFHTWGGVTPMTAHGQLYLFRLGGSGELTAAHGENGQAALTRLDADGGNPAALTFPAGWEFLLQSAVLADEDSLYFIMKDGSTGANTYILVKAASDASGYEEVHRYEDGYDYTLEGYWEKGPVVCAATPLPPPSDADYANVWENRQYTLLAQGMNTGLMNQVHTWTQGDAASTQGNLIYFWSNGEKTLSCINANTGEVTTIASDFAPDDYLQSQLMRTMLDGKLRLQFSTNSYVRDYAADPLTSEVVQFSADRLGDNVNVCAEGAEVLLLRNGSRWVNKDKVPHSLVPGMEISSYSPGYYSMPEYSLISKADYWAGAQRFTKVQDLVYQ